MKAASILTCVCLAALALPGCSAFNKGAILPYVKGRVLKTNTTLGRDWFHREMAVDPYGFGHYVERRGIPAYVFVHDQFTIDLYYPADNEVVRCESSWTSTIAKCDVAGPIPADIRRNFDPADRGLAL